MKTRLVLALLAALLPVLAGTPASPASAASASASAASASAAGMPVQAARPAVRVLTFNACGNVCRRGEVAGTAGNIAYRIYKLNASVAMLQELCYSQYLGVRSRLAPFGYTAVFAAATTGGHCDNDDRKHGRGFGVAIVARGALGPPVAWRLPSPYRAQAEGRVVLGATARVAGRGLFVVTTHTVYSGPDLPVQMDALRRWITPRAGSSAVLFGGDLNVLPDYGGLDAFYGAFWEADHDRAQPLPTFMPTARKIDYLFGSKTFFLPGVASRACGPYSDHCMYLGVFT